MRQPFQLPPGCDPVSFNIDIIPADFPLCSIPPFTDPQTCNHEFPIPDIPIMPPFCPCIRLSPTTGDSKVSGSNLTMQLTVVDQSSGDCCDPCFKLSYNLNIPCLPYSISRHVDKAVVSGNVATLALTFYKPELGCELQLSYCLNIPCLPKTVAVVMEAGKIQGSTPTLALKLTKTDACELQLSYCLNIPCLPKTVAVAMQAGQILGSAPTLALKLTKTDTCELQLSYCLNIPCLPKAVSKIIEPAILSGNEQPTLALTIYKPEIGCDLKLSYQLFIPCLPKTVSRIISPATLSGIGNPTLALTIYKPELGCELKLSYNLHMPCLPREVSSVGTVSVSQRPIGEPGAAALQIALVKKDNCEGVKLSYNLQIGFPQGGGGWPGPTGPTGVGLQGLTGLQGPTGIAGSCAEGCSGGLNTTFQIIYNVYWADGSLYEKQATLGFSKGCLNSFTDDGETEIIGSEACPT